MTILKFLKNSPMRLAVKPTSKKTGKRQISVVKPVNLSLNINGSVPENS